MRARRRALSMTLQALSDASGVSVGYISQIERDHVTPTLGTLAALAQSLGTGLDYFVAMPKLSDSLVRREDRRRFSLDGVTQQYEQLGVEQPNHDLSAFMIYVPDGYSSETVSHEGEEFIHVLQGGVDVTLDGESLSLRTGDSLHFRGNRRHSWENRSGSTTQLLWVGRLSLYPMKGVRTHGLLLDAFAPGRAESVATETGQSPINQNRATGD
ncbi:MAG: XRE family transcriptional regulator [Pseudomonadota bacterium]